MLIWYNYSWEGGEDMQLNYHRAILFTLSELSVDTVDFPNKQFFAVIPGNFLYAFHNIIGFSL